MHGVIIRIEGPGTAGTDDGVVEVRGVPIVPVIGLVIVRRSQHPVEIRRLVHRLVVDRYVRDIGRDDASNLCALVLLPLVVVEEDVADIVPEAGQKFLNVNALRRLDCGDLIRAAVQTMPEQKDAPAALRYWCDTVDANADSDTVKLSNAKPGQSDRLR